jgi:Flp pilus assembly protein CpaB
VVTALPTRRGRAGAISASTVFAVVMALVAGLIFAWVVKTIWFDKKPGAASAPADLKRLTVAARNIRNKEEIRAQDIKVINVSEEEYNRRLNGSKEGKRVYLDGRKPVGRTTVSVITAEEPIFEDQLEPFGYPKPVSEFLRPGMRAVVVEVPANSAMIQVGDVVDVLATLGHDNPLSKKLDTTTATLAKNLRVVARFNSTRTAAAPNPGPRRTYTLEATPYRAQLLELAKNVGCTFSLPVSPRQVNEDGTVAMPDPGSGMDEPSDARVTDDDLAKAFGFKKEPPPKPAWEVERYTGVSKSQSLMFPNWKNPADEKKAEGAAGQPNSNGIKPAVTAPPAPSKPPAPRNPVVPTSNEGPQRSASLPGYRPTSETGVVAAATEGTSTKWSFRPPAAAQRSRGCATCGK